MGNLDNENYEDSKFFLVLEYANSDTLRNYLKDNFHKLNWNIKLKFAIQISDAVSYVHSKNIIHRDLVSICYFNYFISKKNKNIN
jgi:serine/threonine protein kinase